MSTPTPEALALAQELMTFYDAESSSVINAALAIDAFAAERAAQAEATLEELTNGKRVILAQSPGHAKAMYVAALFALKAYGGLDWARQCITEREAAP